MLEPEAIARGADYTVNLVLFFNQEFRQVRTVLPENAGDEGSRHRSRGNLNSPFLMRFEQIDVRLDHKFDQALKRGGRLPAEVTLGFAGVAYEQVHFRRAEVAGINGDAFFPIQSYLAERF